MGTIVSGGRIWHSHRHGAACMGVVGKRAQGFWLEAREGGGIGSSLASFAMHLSHRSHNHSRRVGNKLDAPYFLVNATWSCHAADKRN